MKNISMPSNFDPEEYKKNYPDLKNLDKEQLIKHYNDVGKQQGRFFNNLKSRKHFINLIPSTANVLEIGPFFNPIVRGPNVKYCDVFDQQALQARAKKCGGSPRNVPFINYVLDSEGLDKISEQFDIIISCHNIEHYPDLVTHLQQVERRLTKPHGKFFTIIPDKRYCFDRRLPSSSIADILEAFYEKRTKHSISSIIEHRALTIHNDSIKHWKEQNDIFPPPNIAAIKQAIDESLLSKDEYIDVHAWQFTPDSFTQIVETLKELELIKINISALYNTLHGSNEFWTVLGFPS